MQPEVAAHQAPACDLAAKQKCGGVQGSSTGNSHACMYPHAPLAIPKCYGDTSGFLLWRMAAIQALWSCDSVDMFRISAYTG